MVTIEEPVLLCISGTKKVGKTTCIENIIPKLVERGLKVAVIKHDGHDFEADVPDTDTYRHKQAGAYGTAIFSKKKYMIVKEQEDTKEEALISCFPEADIILIEGLKASSYPKIEIVSRKEGIPICNASTVLAYMSDEKLSTDKTVFTLTQYEEVANFIYAFYERKR